MNTRPQNFVSVIIPVCNDSKRLEVCLDALEKQTYPQSLYEVVVVDNNSQESVESVVGKFSQARSTTEKQFWSYAARNKGISVAKGDILAFTDSDCLPAHDWIEKGVDNLLRHENCGIVGGRVDVLFKNPNQPTAVELYEGATAFPQKKYIEVHHFAVTANLFTFRKVVDKVGGFDQKLESAGDRDWGERVAVANYKLVYADDVRVEHPARHSLGELYRKTVRVVGGLYDLRQKKQEQYRFPLLRVLKLFAVNTASLGKMMTELSTGKNPKGLARKLKVMPVVAFIKYVKASEETKLELWGKSKNHLRTYQNTQLYSDERFFKESN